MDNLTTRFTTIGLNDSDLDDRIDSVDEIVHHVSSSNRLFRKTIKHLILRDIKHYFANEIIELNDELKVFFPRNGRRLEWIKFSYYLDFKVPALKMTKFSVVLLTIFALSIVTLILWLVFVQTDLLIHSTLSNVPLISVILMASILPLGLIVWLGQTALPAKTVGDLADEIISKNLSELLAEDKKRYKEIILKELTD